MSDLEKQVANEARKAVRDAIVSTLTGYDSALKKICNRVVEMHEPVMTQVVNEQIAVLLGSQDFKQEVANALNHKLARVLIQELGGELEAQVGKLKRDPTTRAKITVAIDHIVSERLGKELTGD